MAVIDFPRRAAGIPGDLRQLSRDWLDHKRARSAAANTLAAYAADLELLAEFLARRDITLVQHVSEYLLDQWLDQGVLHMGWSPRTAARRLSTVRNLLAWCMRAGLIGHNPAAEMRVRFRAGQKIAPEMHLLFKVVSNIGTRAPVDLRDRAILMLLLDGALRAGEVATLDLADPAGGSRYCVHLHSCRVSVRPKGGSDDTHEVVGIEPQTVESVRAWLKARPKLAGEGERALFVNKRGQRLSRQSIYVVVRSRGAAVGLPKLHPHLFRHRRIGEVAEKLGLSAANALARHAHASTTANIYGHHAAEVQRQAIRNHAPLGEVG